MLVLLGGLLDVRLLWHIATFGLHPRTGSGLGAEHVAIVLLLSASLALPSFGRLWSTKLTLAALPALGVIVVALRRTVFPLHGPVPDARETAVILAAAVALLGVAGLRFLRRRSERA